MIAGDAPGEDHSPYNLPVDEAETAAAIEDAVHGRRANTGIGLLGGFGAFLVTNNVVDRLSLERAQRAADSTGERLDQALIKLGLVSDGDLSVGLSRYLGIPVTTSDQLPAAPILSEIIDVEFVRHNKVMPLKVTDGSIIVGIVDPFQDEPLRALAYLTGLRVEPHILIAAEYEKAFSSVYRKSESGADDPISKTEAETNDLDIQRLRDIASEAPTIRLVNQIIADAVELRASDIHIEPTVDSLVVRYRVDGRLRTAQTLGTALRAAITSRIKIMSKLDIAERRLPQDGRIKMAIRGVDIDFRVSTIPTGAGESVVMRILDRTRVELDFNRLGFDDTQITTVQKLLNEPNGIILVTGPTGSGKSTTLYTGLKALNSPETKIFTVEDPIEYQLTGINQVQVQPMIGLDFPHALRSILRQDPDIIMIGEIRDLETARIAIQASLTGHLVLSTLHTNSAAAAITRLMDMGLESYLLSSTVKAIVAQRLVRKLCSHCSVPHTSTTSWTSELIRAVPAVTSLGSADIRQAHGCSACDGTGFSGRSTIAEILVVDPDVQNSILSRRSDIEIEDLARRRGMATMYEAGIVKVWRGQTTIEEVLRATRMG